MEESNSAVAVSEPITEQLPMPAETHAIPVKNVGQSILKNSAAQVVGRALIAILRLVAAGIVVRTCGKTIFGQYSLVFGILAMGDWFVDFGTTEVFVREICRERDQRQRLLQILTAARFVQIPIAFTALVIILVALRYPAHLIEAGIVGALNVIFFGGVLIYRTTFKSNLTLEREAAAEVISGFFFVPLTWIVCKSGGGLVALMACHLVSRAIFFAGCVVLGRDQYKLSFPKLHWEDLSWTAKSSVAIGVIGFLVGGYEFIDLVLLSKLGDFSQVAYYSGAQRLTWPLLMVLTSVSGTFYPVLASYWPKDLARFKSTCQRAAETVLLLAGVPICSIFAASEFYMGLIGPDLVPGANALRMLGVLCFVKSVTATLGPVMYVLKAQRQALKFIAVALVMKVVIISSLIPYFGYMGVAYGAVSVETIFIGIPAIYLLRKISGYHLQWGALIKLTFLVIISALVAVFVGHKGTLLAAFIAPLCYGVLVFATRAVRISEIQALINVKRSAQPATVGETQ